MTLDPELSVVVSFIGFSWIFVKKIYPLVTKALDAHIEAVKSKILEAESLKDEASAALEKARTEKNALKNVIEENRLISEKKIKRLRMEHEESLKLLRKHHEALLKTQLEAELAKQKDQLVKKLSILIKEKLLEKVVSADYRSSVSVTQEDLKRLL
jgi:F0F1-type ATP synthase membrane subunit b/b'